MATQKLLDDCFQLLESGVKLRAQSVGSQEPAQSPSSQGTSRPSRGSGAGEGEDDDDWGEKKAKARGPRRSKQTLAVDKPGSFAKTKESLSIDTSEVF